VPGLSQVTQGRNDPRPRPRASSSRRPVVFFAVRLRSTRSMCMLHVMQADLRLRGLNVCPSGVEQLRVFRMLAGKEACA